MAPLIWDLPSYRGLEFVLMFVLVQWDLLVVVASAMHSFLCRLSLSLSNLAVDTSLHPTIMGKKGGDPAEFSWCELLGARYLNLNA